MSNDIPIAITGLSYRAPGVGRKGLWDYLAEAKCAWSKVPADRFDQDAYYNPVGGKAGCFRSKGAHFLPDDPFAFDAPFFHLRPEEARAADPHHRMMLECALEAAENAGLSLLDLAGADVGVFAAIGALDYIQQAWEDVPLSTTWSATGAALTMFANRLSYFFDLAGPSVSLETACAGGCTALHLACQSIRSGECKAAFVGAMELLLGPGQWSILDKMGALSEEGKCFSYDIKASGFGRGEGGGCFFLKRLDDAIRDGDPIHAVVRNSACGHVGRSEGITMPRNSAQASLIQRVHDEVNLSPSGTRVVEGHGPGTKVGDPIEAEAFANVLGSERSPESPLYIGSLKSNFGHLEAASGIMGMIKAILMVQRGYILPTANFEQMNPAIKGKEKLEVARTVIPWPQGAARRVLVTNFGFGGSNAAVIIEAAPSPQHTNGTTHTNGVGYTNGAEMTNGTQLNGTKSNGVTNGNGVLNGENHDISHDPLRLFVFSAKTKTSLTSYLPSFVEYLNAAPQSSSFTKDICYTLGQRRSHFNHRVAMVANSTATLEDQLAAQKVTKIKEHVISYVFTGQGAQHAQMAAGLQGHIAFTTAIDEAEKYLRNMGATWSLKEELGRPDSESRINDAELSQPACTAVQIALVTLLQSWGITPARVTGHSSGEIAAAFAAGLVSFKTAMAISYFRGQATAELASDNGQKGAMLALGISAEVASTLLDENTTGYATIAAINSPQSVTLSGDEVAIESIQKLAESQGMFVRRLKVGVAYHSRHMERAAASYTLSIKPFCNNEPRPANQKGSNVTFVSSVTGGTMNAEDMDVSYWVKNLLQPVQFAEAIRGVVSANLDGTATSQQRAKSMNVLVEIGPHGALKNPIKQTLEGLREKSDKNQGQAVYLSSLTRGTNSEEAILGLAANLFTLGSPIQLAAVNQIDRRDAHVLSDLPAYAWDKSTRYALQFRIAKQRLHPSTPYDPLLGWKSAHTEGNEHAFRQVFDLDEMPWIRDHCVGEATLFPMTGYISMAIEAVRRVSPTVPRSISLREFHAKRTLAIEEDERIDITIKLRPVFTGTETFSSTAWSFEVLTWKEESGWSEHCHGIVEPDASELTMKSPAFKESLPLVNDARLQERNMQLEYQAQENAGGTRYGPAFKTVDKMFEGPGFSQLETELRDLDLSWPARFGSLVTVDPPTLDSFLQGFGALGASNIRGMLLPNYIRRIRISNNIPANKKQRFTIITRILDEDVKAGRLRVSMAVFANMSDSLVPVAEWESMTIRAFGSTDSGDSTLPESFYQTLTPSLDFVDNQDILKILEIKPFDQNVPAWWHKMDHAAIYYVARALKETVGDDSSQREPHFAQFLDWAKGIVSKSEVMPDNEAASFLAGVSTFNAQGKLLCAVGEKLVSILRGEVKPLEIMLKDNLLAAHYEGDIVMAQCNVALAKWVQHLSNIDHGLRILEIGAGTGATTRPVLEALSHGKEEAPGFSSYTYTDISSGFFENAREKLSRWSQNLTFAKLDISQDPAQQGFATADYDLIIAANVLHATSNMNVTMEYVRSLLKPNGKLLVLEAVYGSPRALPFKTLPGWWLSEDEHRSYGKGCLMPEETWDRLFKDCGFSGLDGSIQDFPGTPDHSLSVMCSTRVGISKDEHRTSPITICGPLVDAEEVDFAKSVSEHVAENLGCATSVKPFTHINPEEDPFCIVIDSPRHTMLKDVSSDFFEDLKQTLLHTVSMLWVIPENSPPDAGTIKGLIHTMRIEDTSKGRLFFNDVPCTSQGAVAIANIAKQLRDPEVPRSVDVDFTWNEGRVHVPRFRPLMSAPEVFASEAGVPIHKVQNIWQCGAPLELTVSSAGSLDFIYFRRTSALDKPLGDEEVLIQVEAAGMGLRDLLHILGSIPWGAPGYEAAGKVIQAGARVTHVQPGDRVFFTCMEESSYATHARKHSSDTFKIPDGVTSAEAATIFCSYAPAVMSLMNIARIRKGESVLIHAASGALGQACIAIAKYLGAEIFATAGNPTKRQFLHEEFGIPRENIFSSRTPEFRDGILCATKGKGVDVVINSLAGNLLQETWAVIADFGRFVEMGKKDLISNSHLGMRPFDRNVTFTGFDPRAWVEKRPDDMRACLNDVVDMLQRKIVVPIRPITEIPISQIATGFRKLQSGGNIGKIVVTMGPDESVLAESPPPAAMRSSGLLRPDVTYIITGGTRGIGLALGPWMVENGARNVVLLGRSGASNPKVQKVLQQYEGTDVRTRAIACDAGSRSDVVNAIQLIQDLPSVGGVVHGALVLRDAFLVNATYDDWKAITRPRIQGAWNLHDLFPNLDFFIILSSWVAETGNAGQSIYAGTAGFFNAFTKYRRSNGQSTSCVALPLVTDVGFAVENNITEKLRDNLDLTLTLADIKTVFKGAIIGSSSGLNHDGMAFSGTNNYAPGRVLFPWQSFRPLTLLHSSRTENSKNDTGASQALTGWRYTDNADPLLSFLDALITKVSSITMIERDEVEPDAPVSTYGLDSLVSVELRNWIRRETSVELPLNKIVGSENLRALATHIFAQRDQDAGGR